MEPVTPPARTPVLRGRIGAVARAFEVVHAVPNKGLVVSDRRLAGVFVDVMGLEADPSDRSNWLEMLSRLSGESEMPEGVDRPRLGDSFLRALETWVSAGLGGKKSAGLWS